MSPDELARLIPPEVVEAARIAFANAGTADDAIDPIRAALAAGLAVWPDSILMPAELILPLTQEGGE